MFWVTDSSKLIKHRKWHLADWHRSSSKHPALKGSIVHHLLAQQMLLEHFNYVEAGKVPTNIYLACIIHQALAGWRRYNTEKDRHGSFPNLKSGKWTPNKYRDQLSISGRILGCDKCSQEKKQGCGKGWTGVGEGRGGHSRQGLDE